MRENRPVQNRPRTEPRYFRVTSADGTSLEAWTNDGDGPTVLLCNGLGTNPYCWPALLEPDCGVRVVSWQHRGTGNSARPMDESNVGIDEFVDDALAVMNAAGIESCVLAGWSMGVNTMFEFVLKHPSRVTGLFAVAGVPGGTFSSMLAPLGLPRPLRAPITINIARVAGLVGKALAPYAGRFGVAPSVANVISHSGFMLPTADLANTAKVMTEFITTPLDWYMHMAVETSKHVRVSLRDVTVPTSFVAGKYDVLASADDMRTASQRIDGAAYHEFKASHFIQMEKPAEVHALLLELLGKVEAIAAKERSLIDQPLPGL